MAAGKSQSSIRSPTCAVELTCLPCLVYLLTLSEIPIYLDPNPSYLRSTKRVAYLNHSASLPDWTCSTPSPCTWVLVVTDGQELPTPTPHLPTLNGGPPTWRATRLLYAATGTRSLVFFYSTTPTLKEDQVFQLENVRLVPQQRGCLPTLLVSWLPLWTGPVGLRFWLYRQDEVEIYECPRGRQRLMQRNRK